MVPTEEPGRAARLDALRLRLYRAGATDEDLLRYRAALDVEPPVAPEKAASSAPSRDRRRLLPAAVLIAAAGAAIAGVGLSHGLPVLEATAAAPPPGDVALPAPGPTDSGGFVPGQGKDFTAVTTRAQGAGRVQEFQGRGDAAVPLDVADLSFSGGGRVAVVLTAASTGSVAWRAVALESRRDWTSEEHVLAQRTVAVRREPALPVPFTYNDVPPMRIDVEAPPDVRWTLVVVFGDAASPGTR